MANALIPGFYGTNLIEYARGVQGVSLQLHITAECDQMCKHCYMYNSPFYSQQKNAPLEKQDLFNLIDEYFSFLAEYSTVGFIAITGGDPILSPHFFELLEYINNHYRKRCTTVILGNPFHIFTNEGVVNVAIPFELKMQYECKHNSLNMGEIYLICTNYSFGAVKTALNEIIAAFDTTISNIVLCLPSGFNCQFPIEEFGDKVCISSVDLIPPNSLLLWDREIQSDTPNINSIMVALYNKWIPLINKRQYAAVSDFGYGCINIGDFYGVSNYKTEIQSVASYFENSVWK